MARASRGGRARGSDADRSLRSNTAASSSDGDCMSVAAVAASSVDGYLRNASRRLRVPAAEGGRGTRRKADMVTSSVTIKKDALASLCEEETRGRRGGASDMAPVIDADDEWDEVELLHAPASASKSESTAMFKAERQADQDAPTQTGSDGQTVPLPSAVKLEHLQDPARSGSDHNGKHNNNNLSSASRGEAAHDSNGGVPPRRDVDDGGEDAMMRGTRPPLIEQQRSDFSPWHQSDPAYIALMEQRDLLAAQRRSERIHATCKSIVELMSVVIRGRMLWREAHHPQLAQHLLHRRVAAPQRKSARSEVDPQPPLSTTHADVVQPEYYFLHAVMAARDLLQRAGDLSMRKRSLAPTWVTLSKDGLGNATSQAILVLLRSINDHFELRLAPPAADTDRYVRQVSALANDASTTMTELSSSTVAAKQLFAWNSPLRRGYLWRVLRRTGRRGKAVPRKTGLCHPVYFCVIFLALAHLSGMPARLLIAKGGPSKKSGHEDGGGTDGAAAAPASNGGGVYSSSNTGQTAGSKTFLQKMSIFVGKPGHAAKPSACNGSANDRVGDKRARAAAAAGASDEVRSKRLPTSSFWVEVWSAERQCFTAVNPCASCTTLWAAPYTFSIDGTVAVDATARYSSKYSAAFFFNRRLGRCRQYGFLWKDKVAWDDRREVVDVLLLPFCTTVVSSGGSTRQESASTAQAAADASRAAEGGDEGERESGTRTATRPPTETVSAAAESHTAALRALQHTRETAQLESLKYAETVPNTLNALHHHPLFVIESDLARHEAVYPKDTSTIVASVKGRTVYKRSAVVSLRSVDGWLREGRAIRVGEVAYKTAPPPTSRPFAQPSQFFGLWQTVPFAPIALDDPNDPIPHHGRTWWYILLDRPPPAGLVHLTQPQIVRVVRRMHVDYGLAVTGFVRRRISERRRGHWEVIIDGVVIKESSRALVERAYEEWVQLVQEQEATKRRNRACQWWLLMTQRLLATDRLQSQYMQGKQHGSLPTW